MDFNFGWEGAALLFGAGLIAGVINTLAGGGSAITVPALILLGVPGTMANATNRVSVFFQCLSGVRVYAKKGVLDRGRFLQTLWPTLGGGFAGAWAASIIPNRIFEPLVFGVMLLFSLYLAFKKKGGRGSSASDGDGAPLGALNWGLLFSAGFYGGFIQTGVGIYLLFVLFGAIGFDLNRANALKMALVLPFTVVALAIFIVNDLVLWAPGLAVAAGSALGAYWTASRTDRFSPELIRWATFGIVASLTLAYLMKRLFLL